jgi:hypothetical protein
MMPPKKIKLDTPIESCVIHFPEVKEEELTEVTPARYEKLLEIHSKRLKQPVNSSFRMGSACAGIPTTFESGLGYHRECYKRFSSHLDFASSSEVVETDAARPQRVPSDESEKYIFNADFIFCSRSAKKKKQKGNWATERTSKFEVGGGETIQQLAEEKHDFNLLRRIKGYDLFACEARYHPSVFSS